MWPTKMVIIQISTSRTKPLQPATVGHTRKTALHGAEPVLQLTGGPGRQECYICFMVCTTQRQIFKCLELISQAFHRLTSCFSTTYCMFKINLARLNFTAECLQIVLSLVHQGRPLWCAHYRCNCGPLDGETPAPSDSRCNCFPSTVGSQIEVF